MKKTFVIGVCVVCMMVFALQVFAEYDQAAVKEAMRSIGKLYGEASKAAKAEDYFTAAEKLMGIAQEFKALEAITPTVAPKEEWDRIHGEMINAAFQGIGACGEEDQEKLQAAFATLGTYKSEGHKTFIKK